MATKDKTDQKEERGESLTGTTPKLADLKVGTVLHAKFKGKEHTGTVVDQDGIHLLKVAGKVYRSLSMAGQAITQKACRGGVFWGLLPRPDYRAAAGASPAPKKPTPKRSARAKSKPTKRTRRAGRKAAK